MITKLRVVVLILLFLLWTPPSHADFAAQKEVVKVSRQGFEPSTLRLQKEDASVFFVNATTDSLLTFEIEFGDRRAHCATSNMQFIDGVMKSQKPVGPRDFALMCFPEKGSYSVRAFGAASGTKPITGTIIVE